MKSPHFTFSLARLGLIGGFAWLHVAAAEISPATTARILPIADRAFAGSSVNVTVNPRSALFTDGTTQYAAFYDADTFLVLARRTLGSDQWETHRTAFRGHVADAHNAISLAVDGAGFLHVAWDHHDSPLHYARSVAPGSLELGAPRAMTGQREDRVTYPQFHRLLNGDLLFLYRDGGSGNGVLVLKRYATATGQWSVVQGDLVDGEGRANPYWDLCIDAAGTLHLAWTWRDTPEVATNHDLAYARSTDGGVTWLRTDGTALSLPLTAASVEYAQRIPAGHNLMNPPVIGADSRGRPSICSYWSPAPGAPPQFQIVHHDGAAWRLIPGPSQPSSFNLAGTGTKHPPISRAVLLIEPQNSHPTLSLLYRDAGDRIVVATHDDYGRGEWTLRALNSESLGGWEPSVDPILWQRFSQVHVLVQRVTQREGDDHSGSPQFSPIASLIWSPALERMFTTTHPSAHGIPGGSAAPDTPISASAVLQLAQRVADWQWANFPPPAKRDPRDWTIAPFYLGVLALDRISPDHHNRERMLQQAESLGWEPRERLYHADDQCVIQAYLELHHELRDARMMAPSRARLDAILAHPSTALFDWGTPNSSDVWSWCDSLFMAPVAWLEMWRETGDHRYLDFMNREWWRTTSRLYRPSIGFYFRDESYLDLREPNGRTIHWARGNGWVFAGLARVLALLPSDHPDHAHYVQLYHEMAAAVLASQQPDGLWRTGLLDPAAHPARETSGSSFYAFGLAWGVNHGLLDRAATAPAIRRAWQALTASVTADGKLEDVQPIGAAPENFDPHHTDAFAVGAFLLAASEVYRFSE